MIAVNWHNDFKALSQIRDRMLLLTLANDYLCDKIFLFKAGVAIESFLDPLAREIQALKKRFPGKFIHDIDTDKILNDIKGYSEVLKTAGKEIRRKCASGQLGKELDEKVNAIARTIQMITEQVEGASAVYGPMDMINKLFSAFKSTALLLWKSMTFLVRITVLTGFILFLIGNFLFWTIETDEAYVKQITQSEETIVMQESIIQDVENKKKIITKQIEILKGTDGDINRNEKIQLLDLSFQLENLERDQQKAAIEIEYHKKKIEENQRIVKEMNQKSILEKLFRL